LKKFKYLEPRSVEELNEFTREAMARNENFEYLAGGTDLNVRLKQGLENPDNIINLKSIPELSYIKCAYESIKIGALTTLMEIEEDENVKKYAEALHEAVTRVASEITRYTATLGGNIAQSPRCIYYNQSYHWRKSWEPCYRLRGNICHKEKDSKHCQDVYMSDIAPVLAMLEAQVVVINNKGEKMVISFEDVISKSGRLKIKKGELIAEFIIPIDTNGYYQRYLKFARRKAIDYQLLSLAACLHFKEDTCALVKMVAGGVARSPVRLLEIENYLKGRQINEVSVPELDDLIDSELGDKAVLSEDFSAADKMKILKAYVNTVINEAISS